MYINSTERNFEKFYLSILRGNEVEFKYLNRQFYVLPYFGNEIKAIGVRFGESYSENEIVCLSQQELFTVQIGSVEFGHVFSEIEIIWQNFEF